VSLLIQQPSGLLLGVVLAALGTTIIQPLKAQVTPLTHPVRIPLYRAIDPSDPSTYKFGILASLNGGSPRPFEFDTGGNGFYATWGIGKLSPWFRSGNPSAIDCTSSAIDSCITTQYDSGLSYSSYVGSSSVSLFGSGRSAPLLTVESATIGQTVSITNGKKGPAGSGWSATTGTTIPGYPSPYPPVQGRFFGDFGMAVKPGQNGPSAISSLVTQKAFWSNFGPSVTPGYRVHASGAKPWVQFGLSGSDDLEVRPRRFRLNNGGASCGTDLGTGGINCGSLAVSGSPGFSGENQTTVIFDTGATTTIHTTDSSNGVTITGQPFSKGSFPCDLTTSSSNCSSTGSTPSVINGASVTVTANSVNNKPEIIFNLNAGSTTTTSPLFNQINVQGYDVSTSSLAPACQAFNNPCYYLNTGILPFLQNDVIVDLSQYWSAGGLAELTLVAQPLSVPAPAPLLGVPLALGFLRRQRRRMTGSEAPSRHED
jgi:hypothetical protein